MLNYLKLQFIPNGRSSPEHHIAEVADGSGSARGGPPGTPRRRRWPLRDGRRLPASGGTPAAGVQRRRCRKPGGVQLQDFVRDPAVADDAAGIRSGVNFHAGLVRFQDPLAPPLPQARACAPRSVETLASAWAAMSGKVAMLMSVGTIGTCCSTNRGMCRGSSPVACSMQSMPASSMSSRVSSAKQCAVTLAPSSWAARTASRTPAAGNDGARSPAPRSIQSPTSLTQPSPAAPACARPRPGPPVPLRRRSPAGNGGSVQRAGRPG